MSCAKFLDTAISSKSPIRNFTGVTVDDCCNACVNDSSCYWGVFLAQSAQSGLCDLYGALDRTMSAPGFLTLSSPKPTKAPPPATTSDSPNTVLIIILCLGAFVVLLFLARMVDCGKLWRAKTKVEIPYKCEKLLGEGTYGCVFLATNRDGKKYALKYIPCESPREVLDAYKEFRSIEAVKGHPHLVNLIEGFAYWDHDHIGDPCLKEIPMNIVKDCINHVEIFALMEDCQLKPSPWGYFCIVTDYYAEGTLYHLLMRRRLDRLSEKVILRYAEQICEAVEYIHKCDLIHRDLKPGNVLLNENLKQIVITDFGLTRELEAGAYAHTRAGTLHYFAPEQAQRRYTNKADIWAIGCLIYSMATRRVTKTEARTMFLDRMRPDFEETIISDLEKECYSKDLSSLVMKLLVQRPHERPTATEALEHVRRLLQKF